jgi:hypothetical protein
METSNKDILGDFHASEPRINSNIGEQLSEASKWARFISIVGFIFLTILVFVFFFAIVATGFSGMTGGLTAFSISIGLLMFVAGFFPMYFLFRFSSNIQNGVETSSQDYMEKAFQNLKLFFRIAGIMLAITIGMSIISLFLGIAS